MIEYFILNEEVLAVIVQQNQPLVFRSIGNLARIERVYQAFAANVERTLQMQSQLGIERIANFMPGLIADANKRLSDLYQCVFAPLADLLPSTASLIISGENLLHYIPFHALYNGTDYLCAQFKISYTPSATLIGLCLKPPKHSQGTLLCGFAGNNLHAIYDEIMALDKILPSVEILLGNEATTDAVLSKISGRQLIHLATHARFRTDNPLLSVLKLADRGLSLAEIARLTLDAELVTLSGCETGYGQMMGSDIVSLAGGFLGCGARSLMVSLWRIEDRVTSDFMVHFYSNLLKGMGRSTALQMAQQALLQLGQDKAHSHYAHPAYWAPFILLGNPRALEMLRIS